MNPEIMQQALREAERERDALRTRLGQVEDLIRGLRETLTPNGASTDAGRRSSAAVRAHRTRRRRVRSEAAKIWTAARDVLASTRRPMSVPEVTKQLEANGVTFTGKASPALRVRWAMKRHPELFELVTRGLWALKEWSPEMKKVG